MEVRPLQVLVQLTTWWRVSNLVEKKNLPNATLDDELYQRVLAETPNQLIRFAPIRFTYNNNKIMSTTKTIYLKAYRKKH